MKNNDIFHLFPSTVFKTYLIDEIDLNQLVDGVSSATISQVRSDVSYSTIDRLHYDSTFASLSSQCLGMCDEICDLQTLRRDNLYITSMWGNVSKSHLYSHSQHIHPNSYLSGIVYLKGPENCSGTTFHDPRPAVQVLEPDYEEVNSLTLSRYETNFEEGKVMIFPSWLPHSVVPSLTSYEDGDVRVTLSFNVMFHAKIEKPTAPLTI